MKTNESTIEYERYNKGTAKNIYIFKTHHNEYGFNGFYKKKARKIKIIKKSDKRLATTTMKKHKKNCYYFNVLEGERPTLTLFKSRKS